MPMDGMLKAHDRPLDAGVGGTTDNTRTVLAGFHSAALQTVPLIAFKKVVNIAVTAIAQAPGVTNMIISGFDHSLQIQSTPGDLGVFQDGVALDGTLVYAVDAHGNRVGKFTATGPNMVLWPPCNIHGDNPGAGAIHHKLLSCAGHYDGLIWTAPVNMVGQTVEFKGAAVTDAGYGAHSTIYTIQAPPATVAVAPTITSLVYSTAQSLLFYVDNGSAQMNNAATTFTVQVFDATANAALGTPMTSAASPLVFNLQALVLAANAAGHMIHVTVKASNGVGASVASAPIKVVGGTFAAGVL